LGQRHGSISGSKRVANTDKAMMQGTGDSVSTFWFEVDCASEIAELGKASKRKEPCACNTAVQGSRFKVLRLCGSGGKSKHNDVPSRRQLWVGEGRRARGGVDEGEAKRSELVS
jgi:hypothetical protein